LWFFHSNNAYIPEVNDIKSYRLLEKYFYSIKPFLVKKYEGKTAFITENNYAIMEDFQAAIDICENLTNVCLPFKLRSSIPLFIGRVQIMQLFLTKSELLSSLEDLWQPIRVFKVSHLERKL